MSLEVLPLGVKCNIACTYCYQQPMRSGEKNRQYDLDKMKNALIADGKDFVVFGGEPLLLPLQDLEELLRLSFERGGYSGVQTNATLITDSHLVLFHKYCTHVGISLDGPGELNDTRWSGSLERTRETTAQSEIALNHVLDSGLQCSLIITLSKVNASPDKIKRLIAWVTSLGQKGLKSVRLHLMEIDSPKAKELMLSEDETVNALLQFHRAEPFIGVQLDLFKDMLALLRGKDDDVTCVWNGCDPWTTSAVRGVGPQGESLNCGRTNKTSTNWLKSEQVSHRRQLTLYQTPYEEGGCRGCRFFVVCKGQCPGEAIAGDFRNRSSNCRIWFRVLETLEAHLVAVRDCPISLHPQLSSIESAMLNEWKNNRACSIRRGIDLARGTSSPNYSSTHGDVPHGDSHGDHNDNS